MSFIKKNYNICVCRSKTVLIIIKTFSKKKKLDNWKNSANCMLCKLNTEKKFNKRIYKKVYNK